MSNLQCYLCDRDIKRKVIHLIFIQIDVNESYVVYQCERCKEKTVYCMLCSKIISKLFNASLLFKCLHCKVIVNYTKKEFLTAQNASNAQTVNFDELLKREIALVKENEKKNPQSLLSLRKKKKKISERIDNIKRLTAFHEEETKNIIIN